MNGGWHTTQQLISGVTRLAGLHAFFCVCLLLLPLYGVPEPAGARADTPRDAPTHIGMDVPPPPLLETLPRLGAWGGLERRVLGTLPQSYSLNPYARFQKSTAPLEILTPDLERPTLALLGQWRLEGG